MSYKEGEDPSAAYIAPFIRRTREEPDDGTSIQLLKISGENGGHEPCAVFDARTIEVVIPQIYPSFPSKFYLGVWWLWITSESSANNATSLITCFIDTFYLGHVHTLVFNRVHVCSALHSWRTNLGSFPGRKKLVLRGNSTCVIIYALIPDDINDRSASEVLLPKLEILEIHEMDIGRRMAIPNKPRHKRWLSMTINNLLMCRWYLKHPIQELGIFRCENAGDLRKCLKRMSQMSY